MHPGRQSLPRRISISMAGSSLELKPFSTPKNVLLLSQGIKPTGKYAVGNQQLAHLVFGSSNWFRESEEREGQVHEAVLVGLQLLLSLDNFEELQTHQAHHSSCRSCDGGNDLASYQFTLNDKR